MDVRAVNLQTLREGAQRHAAPILLFGKGRLQFVANIRN